MENHVMTIAAFLVCFPAVVFCTIVRLNSITAVRYQGAAVTFTCEASEPIRPNILWTLNGTQLEELININTSIFFSSMTVGILLVNNVSADINNTAVQCMVNSTYDSTTATSNTIIIRVQGLLNAVGELKADFFERNRSLHILWTPPFSLRVNNMDPSYCMNVVNQTSNTIISSLSSCNRMETYFVVTDIDCVTVYRVIVTPVNPVGNGTSASVVFPDGIGNCNANVLGDVQAIEVSCNFDGMILYAVTLQYTDLSGSSSIIDIHPNNTGDSDRSVIVEGVGDGLYCVTVFPLVNNSDLIRNAVAFRQEYELDRFAMPLPTTAETTAAASTSSISATSISATSISATSSGTTPYGIIQSIPFKYIIPTVVVVVAILVVVILVVVIICCCCYLYKKREKTKSVANNESPSKIPQESQEKKDERKTDNIIF